MTDAELLRELDQEAESLTRCEDVRAGELYAKAAARLRELIKERDVTDAVIPYATHLETVAAHIKRAEAAERERDEARKQRDECGSLAADQAIARDRAERQCAALRDALRGLLSRCKDCGWPIKAEDMTPMQVARAALAPEQGKGPATDGHGMACALGE